MEKLWEAPSFLSPLPMPQIKSTSLLTRTTDCKGLLPDLPVRSSNPSDPSSSQSPECALQNANQAISQHYLQFLQQLAFTLKIMAELISKASGSGPACLPPCFTPHSGSGKSNCLCAYNIRDSGLPTSTQPVL